MPNATNSQWITPDWPAPTSVCAISTTRAGGASATPYDSLNLAQHVGDDAAAVMANRRQLIQQLPAGTHLQWLNQVHGVHVVTAGDQALPAADAAVSSEQGRACCVLTADCLPVLMCSLQGHAVAAAHAGWRGLAAGVLEHTVQAMQCPPQELLAWLGPAIGPGAFQVGHEVRAAFLDGFTASTADAVRACFAPDAARPGHFLADLYALARLRLRWLGIDKVYGGDFCTYSDAERFYSYRRDGSTGRMASVIVLHPS